MKIEKGHTVCRLIVVFMGVLSFATSWVWAKDTMSATSYEFSSIRDTLMLSDSIIVIHTVCAPMCSSHARVYNKEWKEIGKILPPFKSAFPEAYIENGKLLWRDNDTLDYTPVF